MLFCNRKWKIEPANTCWHSCYFGMLPRLAHPQQQDCPTAAAFSASSFAVLSLTISGAGRGTQRTTRCTSDRRYVLNKPSAHREVPRPYNNDSKWLSYSYTGGGIWCIVTTIIWGQSAIGFWIKGVKLPNTVINCDNSGKSQI